VLEARSQHLELLKQQLVRAQNRMKQQADRGRTDREFQLGEMVLLKLQPYVQTLSGVSSFSQVILQIFWSFQDNTTYWVGGL
jgi:Skp family chaperone for outer membrane proteins